MNPTPPQAAGSLNRFLNAIEAAGNKLPHITMLFIWALVITLVISLALSYVSFDYRHPSTGAVIAVTNMLAPANLLDLVVNSVKNFMGFPPLGITLVATLGIGIAEGSGFIHTLLRKLMSYIPRAALTPAVVIVSILCHVASDSVYVILMPLAALMFYCAGRHPLAGVACSFAGLSGGFTASYTPSVIDPVMQSFTQAAAQTLDASYSVNVLCNYFFALGGTFFVIAACWYVTDKIVEPRLWATMPLDKGLENDPDLRITPVSALENSAYRKACTVFLGLAALLFVLCWPEGSMLRAPDGSLTSPKAPVMQAIVPLIFIFFSLPGIVYGYAAGTFKSSSDVIKSMEEVMKMLLGFMVFAFFAAQFLYVFGKSGIGTLLAISGAEFLNLHLLLAPRHRLRLRRRHLQVLVRRDQVDGRGHEDAARLHGVRLLRRPVPLRLRQVGHRHAARHLGRRVPQGPRNAVGGLAAGHHHLHRHAQPSHHLGDLQVGDPFDHLRPDADDARHLA